MKKLFAGLLCGAVFLTTPALAAGPYSVEVDGKALDLGSLIPYEEAGRVMLPLRPVAEALGFTVTWDQGTKTAALDDGTVKSAVTLGADTYYIASSQDIGMSAPQRFGAAPALVEGSTFVPSELFTLLCGQATVEDGVVSLKKAGAVQIPNPMRQYKDLAEASEALGFAAGAPGTLPQGYALDSVWVVGGMLLELRYHGEQGDISFRMAAGQGDVSGDYHQYADTVRQPEAGAEYVLKGDGKMVSLVTWTAGAYSYALSFSPGASADAAVAAARSVKAA